MRDSWRCTCRTCVYGVSIYALCSLTKMYIQVVLYVCVCVCVFMVGGEGCKQLQEVLLNLVKESFGDAQYKKSLDCLRALRRECIQVHMYMIEYVCMCVWG